jgi:cardiolipin synthase
LEQKARLQKSSTATTTLWTLARPGLLAAMAMLLSCCGTVTDVRALLKERALYFTHPQFSGPAGPLTREQGQEIIAKLEAHQKTPSDILQRHLAFAQAISDIPLTTGNKVILLKNSGETYPAMLAAIRGATNNINMEMYIFSDGPIGKMFADALIDRQHHGVQVNVSYDSLGSLGTSPAFFDRMRKAGIMVMQYRPVNPFAAPLHWEFGHRDHRKMLVVDGRVAFTGGINISEVYASGLVSSRSRTPEQYWRDTDIEVRGPAVAEFQKLFIQQWNYQRGPLLQVRGYSPPLAREGNQIVQVIGSVPESFSLIYTTMISAIVNAETNVYITDAYFAPDHQMLHALEHAAQRGVEVRLLVPSKTDEPMIVSAARSHYADLLKAGVKVYEWQGEMLHAKTATIDGVWSTVGTSNLDWWSIARDNELNAVVLSHSFAVNMERMYFDDLSGAHQVTLEDWRHRGIGERMEELGAGIVEPLL